MMQEALREAIAGRPGIADWKIVETKRSQAECFLVGSRPDMSRSIEATDYRLVLYVDSEDAGARFRGEASASVHPSMDASELEELVARTAFAASKSRNPWYPLVEPAPARISPIESAFEAREPGSWMRELRDALYRHDPAGSARINSLELFLSRSEIRILNSRGLDLAFVRHRGNAEYTVEASSPSLPGGVELTDELSFSEPDLERLAAVLASRLALAGDRAAAAPMPALQGLPLILTGREAEAALGWFFENSNASRVYARSSPFAIGESVHGDRARPGDYDPVSLSGEAWISGCPASAPYDADGFPLAPTSCIVDGIARAFVGPQRYTHYLGLPAAGDFALFSVGPGSISEAAMRARPHLEAAYFSNFNIDPDSGDFGGELRLAWYFDGSARRPVTGGSVTGSMFGNRGLIRLSAELGLASSMFGPRSILLPDVSVTGAE